MLHIKLDVNGKEIFKLDILNVSERFNIQYGEGTQLYKISDADTEYGIIEHEFEQGAVRLAKSVLESYLIYTAKSKIKEE